MNWQIEATDVMDWAAQYDGPKFHALLCDPPYAMSNKKKIALKALASLPEKATNADVIAAYHALQQQGDAGFMGRDWDDDVAFNPKTWAALAEHLHPGAFGMAFASARGWHRLAVAIEDAGLRIHPSIFGWSYGSGFPKSTRIDTQVDKAAGATEQRQVIGKYASPEGTSGGKGRRFCHGGQPLNGLPDMVRAATPLARAWQGHRYGLQAMKPALEPIIVFQKPYQGKPVNCITEMGAGALNIDQARIGTEIITSSGQACRDLQQKCLDHGIRKYTKGLPGEGHKPSQHQGRWPANFCLVHHPECQRVGTRRVRTNNQSTKGIKRERFVYQGKVAVDGHHYGDPDGLETVTAWDCVPECPVRRLGEQSGERPSGGKNGPGNIAIWGGTDRRQGGNMEKSTGTAARFFHQGDWSYEIAERLTGADPVSYQSKASRKERDAGLEGFELGSSFDKNTSRIIHRSDPDTGKMTTSEFKPSQRRNPHPTVKPIALARWLATLLLPPPEYAPRRILIPFSGSGSEGIGAGLAGWDEITMIDNEAEYCRIAEARMAHWLNQTEQLAMAVL